MKYAYNVSFPNKKMLRRYLDASEFLMYREGPIEHAIGAPWRRWISKWKCFGYDHGYTGYIPCQKCNEPPEHHGQHGDSLICNESWFISRALYRTGQVLSMPGPLILTSEEVDAMFIIRDDVPRPDMSHAYGWNSL